MMKFIKWATGFIARMDRAMICRHHNPEWLGDMPDPVGGSRWRCVRCDKIFRRSIRASHLPTNIAYRVGAIAFRRRATLNDNPYSPGTESYAGWRRGFQLEARVQHDPK